MRSPWRLRDIRQKKERICRTSIIISKNTVDGCDCASASLLACDQFADRGDFSLLFFLKQGTPVQCIPFRVAEIGRNKRPQECC